jgi:hypothetical protein
MKAETIILILNTVISAAALVALIVYVVKTANIAKATQYSAEKTEQIAEATLKSVEMSEKVLREMEASRELLVAPHVIMYFDNQYQDFGRIFLVVRNVGKGVAYDVGFKFTPALVNSQGEEIGNIFMLKQGIPSLPPGYEIRHSFDRIGSYFDSQRNYLDNGLPKRYEVEVTFYGGIRNEKKTLTQVLDLEVFIGTHVVRVKKIEPSEEE